MVEGVGKAVRPYELSGLLGAGGGVAVGKDADAGLGGPDERDDFVLGDALDGEVERSGVGSKKSALVLCADIDDEIVV